MTVNWNVYLSNVTDAALVSGNEVSITIGNPQKSDIDWVSEVVWSIGEETLKYDSYGIDPIQSLLLSISVVYQKLDLLDKSGCAMFSDINRDESSVFNIDVIAKSLEYAASMPSMNDRLGNKGE